MEKGKLKLFKEDTAFEYCLAGSLAEETLWEAFETTPFYDRETPFLNREGTIEKGTFVLLLKRAGVWPPRTPLRQPIHAPQTWSPLILFFLSIFPHFHKLLISKKPYGN